MSTIEPYTKGYAHGYKDALDEMIRQIRNQSQIEPDAGYTGPLPEELQQWLDLVQEKASILP